VREKNCSTQLPSLVAAQTGIVIETENKDRIVAGSYFALKGKKAHYGKIKQLILSFQYSLKPFSDLN
jgi:hypothetical protein